MNILLWFSEVGIFKSSPTFKANFLIKHPVEFITFLSLDTTVPINVEKVYNYGMPKLKVNFTVTLPITFLREGDAFVAYTPALDLSTVGGSLDEAKTRFDEATRLFFEEIIEKGTINDVLTELGWQRQDNQFIPPTVIANQTEQVTIPHYN